MGPLRVLVVDDSALSRQALRQVLELDHKLVVAGEAKTGEEAIALVRTLKPDLVTMDLNMPGMGGLKAIEAIMAERPMPIVVISERSSSAGLDLNYEALSRGALELVPKSSVFGAEPDDVRRFAERVRLMAEARLDRDTRPISAAPLFGEVAPPSQEPPLLLGIGASTGGPRALAKVLAELPKDFPLPIAIVQHMAEDFFDSFVRFLADSSGRPVVEAESGVLMEPGHTYVAPPKQELFVRDSLIIRLAPAPPSTRITPSVDSLFYSMATSFKARSVGVLLTGMGDDGAQGLLRMRRMGARTVVQDRASCAVFGMPRAAIEVGAAEVVLALEHIPAYIVEAVKPPRSRVRSSLTPQPSAASANGRVLVVDDDPQALAASRRVLEEAGFDVHAVDNPLVVAGVLRRVPVNLVILEPELRTMKGSVVLQALRSHGLAKVPIYLHSKLPLASLKPEAASANAAGFSRKGENEALVSDVTALLRKTRA